jgi:2-polyprenyl-3-methyl-5-hydroxy-6-metoxy-1,4-benzoquinol methylase
MLPSPANLNSEKTSAQNLDKAGERYWTEVWERTSLPEAINPTDFSIGNHLNISFHNTFNQLLGKYSLKGKKLLEVGCANSVWLPYFARQFGILPFGLDYSKKGCEQAAAILKRENLTGEIFHADMFNPPANLKGQFDVVVSLGVVEHFSDLNTTFNALKFFLKPEGLLLTAIPNHCGLLGLLQRIINKPVYDIHIIIDKNDLIVAQQKAGLEIISSAYLPGCSLFVNMDIIQAKPAFFKFKMLLAKFFGMLTKLIWIIERMTKRTPASKMFSPAILTLSKNQTRSKDDSF